MYYYFYLINNKTKSKTKILGKFSNEEYSRLKDFNIYADDLKQTAFLNQQIKFQFKMDKKTGTSFSSNVPKEADIYHFLMKLRPFILKNELTNFYSICNLISKKMKNNELNSIIKEQRDYFNGEYSQSLFTLKIKESIINSEKTLNEWLNAHIYHKDKDKMKKIDDLHSGDFPFDLSKSIWLLLLSDKAKAISTLSSIISKFQVEQ